MRRLWDLWGVKIDSVWALHFKRTSVSIPFCFFMPLGKGRDYHGREGSFVKNGKPMSDAAVDQRLRRWCTKKKGGGLKCAQDIYERYHNMGMDSRNELNQVFKDALLNKDP